jgi:hypothetical protein
MMRRASRALVSGLTILAASAGCADKAANTEAPRAVSITMERNPCFGRCPVYRLDLTDSGKVVYDGRGFVKENGRREATVPPADVQALAKEIEAAGFFGFRDNYPPEATDHAIVVTTVTIDHKTKRVEHNLGSRAAPAALEELYRRIDEVARSKQWVGDTPTAPRPGEKGGGPDTARKDTSAR